MKRLHLIIFGRVQGVLFRFSTKRLAKKLDVKGWVKNNHDGTVELVAEGPEKSLKELLDYCKKGPMMAWVRDMKVKWEKDKREFDKFEVRY